jgi:hypothetical protein
LLPRRLPMALRVPADSGQMRVTNNFVTNKSVTNKNREGPVPETGINTTRYGSSATASWPIPSTKSVTRRHGWLALDTFTEGGQTAGLIMKGMWIMVDEMHAAVDPAKQKRLITIEPRLPPIPTADQASSGCGSPEGRTRVAQRLRIWMTEQIKPISGCGSWVRSASSY